MDKITRRDFLKITGAAGTALILTGCSREGATELNFFDRLFDRSLTDLPQNENAWAFQKNTLTLDLTKLPELDAMGGAVRIESDVLPANLLFFYGEEGGYHAIKNVCPHDGRKIDLVPGTLTLECTGLKSSTFDYQGNVLSGPAEQPLTVYEVAVIGNFLEIIF